MVEVPVVAALGAVGLLFLLALLLGMSLAGWWTERSRSSDLMYLTGLQAPSRDVPTPRDGVEVRRTKDPEDAARFEAEKEHLVEQLREIAKAEGQRLTPDELEEEAERMLLEVDRRM